MTFVDIYAGFLGAGKTTLIKKMIAEAYAGEKLALIENEFGEVGIDGKLLADKGMAVSELDSGCICCSLAGDFTDALTALCRDYAPDRILIEPSGVAALSDVRYAIEQAIEQGAPLTPGYAVTVADITHTEDYLASYGYGEVYEDQLREADLIVFSRTKKLPEEELVSVTNVLRGLNPHASFVTSDWDELSGKDLLGAIDGERSLKEELLHELMPEKACGCEHGELAHHGHGACDGHPHHHGEEHDGHAHEADGIFQSWGIETPRRFTEAALRAMLGELDTGRYGMVLRAKGIVPAEGNGWLGFDYVPNEAAVRPEKADVTGRICVIGVGLDEEALKKLFVG